MDNESHFTALKHRRNRDPTMIGLWKIGRTIGKGSSGRVRIARHTKTKQYAAVKIVSKSVLVNSRMSLASLEDDADRILLGIEREIVIMKLIEHPNIMRLYDVWETSTELYLILEYVEGGELFDYICEKGKLSSIEALGYFQQIISAIDYCHRFNIAHRDLKPENLLLDADKNIKVADFGMAAWQKSNSSGMLKTACGSPHYAAPEVIEGRPYDGSASDIWSCGIVLFALLAGRLPFDDEDLGVLLEKVKLGKYDMPDCIDRQAKHLISRMLEKSVAKRITIPEILLHPFYTSQPSQPAPNAVPKLEDIARPITDISTVDQDVFANLRTLWHGTPDDKIMEKLTDSDRTWEKGVYHLLIQYRATHLENYDEEDDLIQSPKQQHNRSSLGRPRTPVDLHPPRPGPPTPDRAKNSSKTRQKNVPEIMLHLPSPTPSPEKKRAASAAGSSCPPSPNSSSSPPTSPIWEALNLPPLDVPEVQDERVQQFFRQVVDHLNVMQLRSNGFPSPITSHNPTWSSTPRHSAGSSATSPSTSFLPTPVSLQFGARVDPMVYSGHEGSPSPQNRDDGFLSPLTSAFGLGISPKTEPLTVRHVVPRVDDKENCPPNPKRSSMKKNTGLDSKMSRKVHIIEPTAPKKLRRRKSSASPVFPNSPALSEMTVDDNQSAPRRGWFGALFRVKPLTYCLHSLRDVSETRKECRRLLEAMGVHVVVPHSDDLGVLKCRLDEMKDPAGVMGVVKAVKFRVELTKATNADSGFSVALHFIQEKGAQSSFKIIFNRLKREWEFDTPRLPQPERSPTLSMDSRFELVY